MALPPPLDSGGGGKQRVGAQSSVTSSASARMTTLTLLTQLTTIGSSQLTARSATLRTGTTSSGPDARPSLRLTCCISLVNVRTPLAGGLCAGRPTQSRLLAARSVSTRVGRTN